MQFAGHSDIHVAMRYQEAVNDRKKDLAKRMAALAGLGGATEQDAPPDPPRQMPR